jgi:tRNA pseudouridine13 synthase
MLADAALRPPLITAELMGIGGRIKVEPEDFEVEEIPAYDASGVGEFLYLWIEKRDMGAQYFAGQLARRLEIPSGEIGTAGLKDRRAVTRQWVSVPIRAEANLSKIDGNGMKLLEVRRHSNKLRPGHLRGNTFRILIRDAVGDPATVIGRLRQTGLPNFYGTQRFGRDGDTLQIGLDLIRKTPGSRPVRNPFLKKLSLSAVQSALFNAYLAKRMADGLYSRVVSGDVMGKLPYGGIFTVEDVAAEQARFDRREIVTQGPIFGTKMFPAKGEAATREAAILSEHGFDRQSFAGFGKLVLGTRRHNIVYLDELTHETAADGVRVSFTLPAGSYATVVLREIMKSEVAGDEGDG